MYEMEVAVQQLSPNNMHPEINAFMHQQMVVLQQLLPKDAKVGVVVLPSNQDALPEQKFDIDTPVTVKFIIVTSGFRIEVPAKGDNIFEALISAKEIAVQQVSSIQNQLLSDNGWSEMVSDYSKSRNLH
jgi:hypothetical protein